MPRFAAHFRAAQLSNVSPGPARLEANSFPGAHGDRYVRAYLDRRQHNSEARDNNDHKDGACDCFTPLDLFVGRRKPRLQRPT